VKGGAAVENGVFRLGGDESHGMEARELNGFCGRWCCGDNWFGF